MLLKPKEVSLDSPPKEETPNIELQNHENKLFDVDDDVGTSTIADLSVPCEDEEEEVKSNNVWEHSIDILFKLSLLYPDGESLRKWAKHQTWMIWNSFTNGMRNIWQLENLLHPMRTHGINVTQNS